MTAPDGAPQPQPIPTMARWEPVVSPVWKGVRLTFFTPAGEHVFFFPPENAHEIAAGLEQTATAVATAGPPIIVAQPGEVRDALRELGNGHKDGP